MVFILLLQSACDLSGTLLPLKEERVSSSVNTIQSVLAFPFIHANQFFHSNVPCVILGFIMLIVLNANFGWSTCWSKITTTLKSFGAVHSVFAFPFITAIQLEHLNVIFIIFVLFMMIKHMSTGWHLKHIIPLACLILAGFVHSQLSCHSISISVASFALLSKISAILLCCFVCQPFADQLVSRRGRRVAGGGKPKKPSKCSAMESLIENGPSGGSARVVSWLMVMRNALVFLTVVFCSGSNVLAIIFAIYMLLKHIVKATFEHSKPYKLGSASTGGCSGRFPRVPRILFFFILASLFISYADAVCPHCKDTIEHAEGAANCPLVAGVAANVAVFVRGTLGVAPVIKDLVPPFLSNLFPRAVVESIVAIACKPVSGGTIDLSSEAYSAAKSVVQAACYGHCSMDAAMIELSSRLDDAEDPLQIQRLTANIEMLTRKSPEVASSMHGVYTFIWAKLGQVFTATTSVRLPGSSSGTKASDLTASIRHPSSSDEFFETIHYWQLMVHALGLASISLISTFLADVVYKVIRELKETWQVTYAYLLLVFERIENDATRRLHFGNVLENGGQDTLLSKARVNAGAFFRSRGGDPQPGGGKKWNGKFDSSSKQACAAFNNDKEHNASSLNADGSCRFNHRCNQFVSDKGPAGMCWAEHPRCKCTYDKSKCLKVPQK
jgi:hypothetical protein